MSDEVAQQPVASVPEGLTAGAMLRQAREAAGLHVAAMAVSLKVAVGKLEALEQDRYDLLPDAVFARALASSVCRALKIDARPILDRLPQTTVPRLVQDGDGINAPFRSPRDQMGSAWREQLTRPVSLAVGVLLIGAVVVVLLPRTQSGESAAAASAAAVPNVPHAGIAAITPPAAAEQPSGPIVAASMTVPVPADAKLPAETSSASSAPPLAAAAQAADPTPAPAASAPAAAVADDHALVFRAAASSWIEVRDAKGGVPIRKELAAGESASVSGVPPLKVVVGNVRATEVEVRGKPFDLQPIARDNVARFEIR